MLLTLYEVVLAVGLVALLRWIYRLTDRSPIVPVLGGALMLVFVWPWLVSADWRTVGLWALGLAAAGAVVVAYGVLLERIRAAARRRDSREEGGG